MKINWNIGMFFIFFIVYILIIVIAAIFISNETIKDIIDSGDTLIGVVIGYFFKHFEIKQIHQTKKGKNG
ncbi:MAG: hypothetical protein ACRCW6_01060 [Mycoplasmoidaceae bacterium]